MAWNPNIPTATNRVRDDLDAIRENFQYLDQLADRVDELQTVSELASIANDLQAVSELAPYVQEILDSRIGDDSLIVDHNLDAVLGNNGRYVRWGNGLQVCFWSWSPVNVDDLSERRTTTWTYPAAFSSAPFAVLATPAPSSLADQTRMIVSVRMRVNRTATAVDVFSRAIEPMSAGFHSIELFAIGKWS